CLRDDDTNNCHINLVNHVFSTIHTPPPEIYTLSLHDALPIFTDPRMKRYFMTIPEAVQLIIHAGSLSESGTATCGELFVLENRRSEEHTSELQSRSDLVCRLLLEKKNLSAEHTPSLAPTHFPW